ncbi:MAG: sulfotransferase [Burkholderiales bacterium]|nr:sulfotransferase [Burkholderiales bacterium]
MTLSLRKAEISQAHLFEYHETQPARNSIAKVRARKPILVTGSHRSGTTWVGRMLASSPAVGYIHEPFNVGNRWGICDTSFDRFFTYVCEQNESRFLPSLQKTLEFRHDLLGGLKQAQSSRDALKTMALHSLWMGYRLKEARPLMKDPIALFSAEWLHSKFNMDVLVMIRHPAAFAGSIKIMKPHSFSQFLDQPLLMRDHLHPFADNMKRVEAGKADFIEQAALLWMVVHYMILKYRKMHPDWVFIRHEDLSRDPINGFHSIFEKFGLSFGAHEEDTIKKHSYADSMFSWYLPKEIRRNSYHNISTWKNRLTPAEVKKLKSLVGEISREFYSDDEWLV